MGPLFNALVLLVFGACLFVPTFVIALAMLKSVVRAFVLSATFTLGALGGAVAALVSMVLVSREHSADVLTLLQAIFISAGSIGGGVLAVFLLGKVSNSPPWKRN